MHHILGGSLGAQGNGRQHVGAEVDGQNLQDGQWQRNLAQHEGQIWHQFRDVGGEDVGDEFADVFVDCPSLFNGIDDGAEMIIQQHNVGGLTRNIRSRTAHGDANVGHAQGRSIVDSIPCRGYDLAFALQCLNDQHFLAGADSGKNDFRRIQSDLERGGTHLPYFVARDDARRCSSYQIDFPRNGQGGDRVIASDHDYSQAGLVAALNRCPNIRSGRVFQTDQPAQDQLILTRCGCRCEGFPGTGQYPQSPGGHVGLGLLKACPRRSIKYADFLPLNPALTERKKALRRALAVEHRLIPLRMSPHRHPASICIEGQFPGRRPSRGRRPGKLPQRNFHRVATWQPTEEFQAVTMACNLAQLRCRRHRPAFSRKVMAIRKPLPYSHPVLRQCAGLVGENHRRATHGFHRRQVTNQGIAFGHALCRHGQGQGHGG